MHEESMYTVPLNLILLLVCIYSHVLTPFYQALNGSLHARPWLFLYTLGIMYLLSGFLPIHVLVPEDSFMQVSIKNPAYTRASFLQLERTIGQACEHTCSVNSSTCIQTAHKMMHESGKAMLVSRIKCNRPQKSLLRTCKTTLKQLNYSSVPFTTTESTIGHLTHAAKVIND